MKQKVALVLSGGGARGIAHIGVIEELEKQGFNITSVAGTSMGALVAGVYALGTMNAYKEWIITLDKMRMFRLVDFAFRGQGLVKGERLFNKLHEFIDDKAVIEDLKIPYAAIASDIINKREVVFTNGNLINAIRASIAIPTILSPVKTADGLLVDGGVINNLPIDRVKRTPGDIVVAVNVNADIPSDKPPVPENGAPGKQSVYQEKIKDFYEYLHKINPLNHEEPSGLYEEKFGYFEILNKTISLINYHNCQLSLERYSPEIVVNISHECCATYDFYKAEEMIATGERAAVKSLNEYKERPTDGFVKKVFRLWG